MTYNYTCPRCDFSQSVTNIPATPPRTHGHPDNWAPGADAETFPDACACCGKPVVDELIKHRAT